MISSQIGDVWRILKISVEFLTAYRNKVRWFVQAMNATQPLIIARVNGLKPCTYTQLNRPPRSAVLFRLCYACGYTVPHLFVSGCIHVTGLIKPHAILFSSYVTGLHAVNRRCHSMWTCIGYSTYTETTSGVFYFCSSEIIRSKSSIGLVSRFFLQFRWCKHIFDDFDRDLISWQP